MLPYGLIKHLSRFLYHPPCSPVKALPISIFPSPPSQHPFPPAPLRVLHLLPFPMGATNGQQLTSPASKPCRTLGMVFPRRLGRNSSGGAPWECKSEGHGKIFLFLPNSAKPLPRPQLLRVLGDLSSCIIPAAPTSGALSEFSVWIPVLSDLSAT